MLVMSARTAAACVGLAGAAVLGCAAGDDPGAGKNATGSGASAGVSASGGSSGRGGGGKNVSVGGGSASGGTDPGSGGSSASSGSGGTVNPPDDLSRDAMLPARIRRLTNEEYAWSVRALLDDEPPAEINFPPDARQDGFTRNDAQRVDAVLAKQLDASAQLLAQRARARIGELAPCSAPDGNEACAENFIAAFGARAYRRALAADEASGLLEVYRLGASGAAYADGIELVIRTLLQSAGFLYLTELGETGGGTFLLAPHELAAQLSYLITAQPPSEELLAAAAAGALDTPAGRHDAAMTLLQGGAAAQATILRHVREWLGVDRILDTGKDTMVYPGFTPEVRTSMAGETDAFIAAIAARFGTVGELLGADWTMVDPTLAAYYGYDYPGGGQGFQQISLAGTRRRGILNQGSFLSVFAHASESAPVFRGVAVLDRLICQPAGSPVNIPNIPPPPQPDGVSTTRERFETVHGGNNPVCKGCHSPIDAIGFTFEAFDGAGQYRTKENGKDVNTATEIPVDLGLEFSGPMADSADLGSALAQSAMVRACFARHVFRSVAAISGESFAPSEAAFVAAWQADPEAEPGGIINTILTFVESPLFQYRRAE
jgi:hypothetical protein